jgi:ketosteroid isomerase-like protein
MSQQNVELHRRYIRAFNARDVEGLIACCDPNIELHSTFAAADGAVYHGHDGMRVYHQDMTDAWGDELGVETSAYFDLGERTLAFHVLHGRGRASGADVALPIAQVSHWRDGLMIFFKGYPRREDALRALGVSEDELEPIAP